jgi:FtsH-binding integral membrane protein
MQFVITWLILGIAVVLGAYLEVKYARANYPKSLQWQASLFIVGSLTFGLAAIMMAMFDKEMQIGLPLTFVFSLFGGIGFTWLFPKHMRHVIPPVIEDE